MCNCSSFRENCVTHARTHARTHVHTHMVQIMISLRRAGREIIIVYMWNFTENYDHLHCFFVIRDIMFDHIFASHHAGNGLQMSST